MLELFTQYQYILDFLSLVILETILGLDNLVFIALIITELPEKFRYFIRYLAISFAIFFRIILLFFLSHLTKLTNSFVKIMSYSFSLYDILIIFGGFFLIFRSSKELGFFPRKKSSLRQEKNSNLSNNLFIATLQLVFIDLILSFDSVITAIAVTNNFLVIVSSIVISLLITARFVKLLDKFIENNLSIKIICLNFVNLVGIFLTLSGFGINISKNYLYFAMGFSILNEYLIIKTKRNKNA